jgi:hypothetical protein
MNDSRFPHKINPSHNGNRNQTTMSPNGNNNSRNPGQNTAPRNISRNPGIEKSRMNEQSKGLSSAEYQRLQFEREREEIQLKRQNAKQSSGGGPGSMKDASNAGRLPAYHDECDALMDELAGKSNSAINMKSIAPVQIVTAPLREQTVGKSNLLLGAMGLGVSDRSPQPSPQGMKKINLENMFSKKKTVLGPPPGITGPPPGITIPHSSTPNVGMGGLNGSHIFSAVPAPIQHKDFERETDFTKEAVADADDDYEVSMRMIDRMISGDDDYDKDDISTSYSEACVTQPASRYAFSDTHASTINQFGLQQSLGMSLSSIPSTSRSSPVCIGGDSTFSLSSMKIQGESNDSLGSMSHTPYRSGYSTPGQTHTQAVQPTNVLLKLGYDPQSPNRNTDNRTDTAVLHLSSPAPLNSSQKLVTIPSTPKQQAAGVSHSSPFAFHSSSSGCGSSGGGSRRSSGGSGAHVVPTSSSPVPASSIKKSNMSASSWQQLQKMARGAAPTTPRPEEDNGDISIRSTSDDTAKQSNRSTPRQTPRPATVTPTAVTPTTVTPTATAATSAVVIPTTASSPAVTPTTVTGFVGKDVGLHRINVSDLFKASSSIDEKGKKNAASTATSIR